MNPKDIARLITEDPDVPGALMMDKVIVFHGTFSKHKKSIKKHGLGGKGKMLGGSGGLQGTMGYWPQHESGEYVTLKLGTAIMYAYDMAEEHESAPIVVALEWRNPSEQFEYDEDEDAEDSFVAPTGNLNTVGIWRLPQIGGLLQSSPLYQSLAPLAYGELSGDTVRLTGDAAISWLNKNVKNES